MSMVEKHYCMGRVMSIAVFHKVEKCGMEILAASSDKLSNKKHCCDDEVLLAEGQDELQISLDDLSLEQQLFVVTYGIAYLDLFKLQSSQHIPELRYPPPLLVKDIQVLDQVFLI